MFVPFLLAFSPQVETAALDATFSKAVANRGAPASVALLVRDGRVVWAKAAGTSDLAGQHPATLDTPFRIASLTKAFTATLVLQLVAEKKVGLDDPIGGVLPQLPKAWRGATVRHLLNHTSGIPDYTAQPLFALKLTERTTPEDLVARTADKPLDFPSGTKFKYDNTGYVILGMLVERLDRQPFGASLQRRILNPLGMTRTVFDLGDARNVAEGTGPTGRPAQKIHMSQPYAAGSIVSTANDMAKWLVAQGSEHLLPKPLWDEAGKAVTLSDGTSTRYGFGWLVAKMNGVPTLAHAGGIPGFDTFIEQVPERNLGVVVLTSSNAGDATGVGRALLGAADPSLVAATVAIADPDPKITEATERLLHGFERGEPDLALLEPGFAHFLTPERLKSGRDYLQSNGAFQSLRLLKVDGLERVYLAQYENGAVRISIARNAAGLFTGFVLAPG